MKACQVEYSGHIMHLQSNNHYKSRILVLGDVLQDRPHTVYISGLGIYALMMLP
jgi:hypothetical protein